MRNNPTSQKLSQKPKKRRGRRQERKVQAVSHQNSLWGTPPNTMLNEGSFFEHKNFVPHRPEALRYAKVWGRDFVRSLTLAYAKRLFPDSNPWPTSHQGTTLPLHQGSPSFLNIRASKLMLKKFLQLHSHDILFLAEVMVDVCKVCNSFWNSLNLKLSEVLQRL